MIRVDVRTNIAEVTRTLNGLRDQIVDKATASALNRAGTTMQTEGAREVKKIYSNLQIRVLKGYFRLTKAKKGKLIVQINPKGGRLPLTFFPVRTYGPKKGPGGVIVRLGRETVKIPHGFVRGRGKRQAVFIRSPDFNGQLYSKGTFRQKRVQRTGNDVPISELFARSIPEVMLKNGIDATLVQIGERRFSEEFERQLQYYLSTH